MAGRLDGKVALITGTGGGQGRAAAELFCAEGASVVGCDLDAAENGVRLSFRGLRQFVVAERHQPLGLSGGRNPHHAAAIAGQGHEDARTLRGVKLGGDAVVGP